MVSLAVNGLISGVRSLTFSVSSWVCGKPRAQKQLKSARTPLVLNQARASLCAWFLKIDPVWIVGMRVRVCVCPRPRLLITSGMI